METAGGADLAGGAGDVWDPAVEEHRAAALYDLLARRAGVSIARALGGEPSPMPVTAIIGYPPGAMPPEAVAGQVAALLGKGWRRFKIPIALPLEYGAA